MYSCVCMTEILMCEGAVNKGILEKKLFIDAGSERS